jgi:hypothetical protein
MVLILKCWEDILSNRAREEAFSFSFSLAYVYSLLSFSSAIYRIHYYHISIVIVR